MTAFSVYMAKMNEFGLGQFKTRSILWRISLIFDNHEFGSYVRTNQQLHLHITKQPITFPKDKLYTVASQRFILTASMCSAISYLVFGDKYWEKVHFAIYEDLDHNCLILPDDVLISRYFFFVPPITLETNPQTYKIEIRVFFPDKRPPIIYKVSIPEIKGIGKEIKKFVAITQL